MEERVHTSVGTNWADLGFRYTVAVRNMKTRRQRLRREAYELIRITLPLPLSQASPLPSQLVGRCVANSNYSC